MFSVTVSFYDPMRTVAYIETDTPYVILDFYKQEFETTISEFLSIEKFKVMWFPVKESYPKDPYFLAEMVIRFCKSRKLVCVQRCECKFVE